MTDKSNIWVLTDFRVGNSLQGIAIADSLNQNYEIKEIEYNALARLPNALLPNLLHIKNKSRKQLIGKAPPKLIISSGRRCGKVAAILKKYYPDVKLVQVMKPDTNPDIFDLIILPQHDVFPANEGAKYHIIRTIGAINNIKQAISKFKKFPPCYASMKQFIGVLVGGNTKEYKFSQNDAVELCEAIKKSASYNDMPAFITFSRRTPAHLKKLFYKNFKWPHIIYDPAKEKNKELNPYIGILKKAKFIILTCDSVSMCSEVASSGKPNYIYCPNRFHSKKHKYMMQQLVDLKIAKVFSKSTGKFEPYKYAPLDEVLKVRDYIKQNFLPI